MATGFQSFGFMFVFCSWHQVVSESIVFYILSLKITSRISLVFLTNGFVKSFCSAKGTPATEEATHRVGENLCQIFIQQRIDV